MIYGIVNEFLGSVTFNNPTAEDVLIAALKDESRLTLAMCSRVEEVLSAIFFYYPKACRTVLLGSHGTQSNTLSSGTNSLPCGEW